MKPAGKLQRGGAIDYSNCYERFVKKKPFGKSDCFLSKSQESMVRTLIASGLSRKKLAKLILHFDEGASAKVTIKKEFTNEAYNNDKCSFGTQTTTAAVSKSTQTEIEFSK